MHHSTPTPKKDAGSIEDKPVTTEVTVSGEHHVIEATHHIVSDAGVVSLYLGARSEGIDIQIIDETVLCRSERARDRLGMHASTDTETVKNDHTDTQATVMTDGGVDVDTVERGDAVMSDGHECVVQGVTSFHPQSPDGQGDSKLVIGTNLDTVDPSYLHPSGLNRCAGCGVLTTDGQRCVGCEDGDDDEKRLVTDGGRNAPGAIAQQNAMKAEAARGDAMDAMAEMEKRPFADSHASVGDEVVFVNSDGETRRGQIVLLGDVAKCAPGHKHWRVIEFENGDVRTRRLQSHGYQCETTGDVFIVPSAQCVQELPVKCPVCGDE